MGLLANPEQIRKVIPIDDNWKAVLVMRPYTTNEYKKFMQSRYPVKGGNKVKDKANDARIEFVDMLLQDVESINSEGEKDSVEYRNDQGEVKPLNPQVENWKSFIDPSWKIAACVNMEGDASQVENETVKNS